jgi:hypothetical protein
MPLLISFERNEDHGTIGCTIGGIGGPHAAVTSFGADPVDALHNAAALAAQLQSAINGNPALQAAVSVIPGGTAGLAALTAASSLLKSGGTIDQVAKAIGPSAAGIVKGILSFL